MIIADSIARFSAAFLLVFVVTPVGAETIAEKMQFCDTAGEVALAATAARDKGVTKAQAQGLVDDVGAAAPMSAFFSAMISLIYAMEGVEAPLMQQVAVQMCHKKLGLK